MMWCLFCGTNLHLIQNVEIWQILLLLQHLLLIKLCILPIIWQKEASDKSEFLVKDQNVSVIPLTSMEYYDVLPNIIS